MKLDKSTLPGVLSEEFHFWLLHDDTGSRFLYWKGRLVCDRWSRWWTDINDKFHYTVNIPVDTLAKQVWDAYMNGAVYLTQKRIGPDQFEYWAEKRSK